MSNHFTGLSLGPPLGDQRLDLCDLYAFQSPADKNRTVLILNANPNADALHPDAIYRLNIDTDGDYLTDIAFSYVFSKPQNGSQTVNVFVATGSQSRSAEAVGTKIIADAPHRLPDEKPGTAHGPQAPHRHPEGVSVPGHTACEKVAEHEIGTDADHTASVRRAG